MRRLDRSDLPVAETPTVEALGRAYRAGAQPYEDYGLQKFVEFAPNPNQALELRKFNFRMRRA